MARKRKPGRPPNKGKRKNKTLNITSDAKSLCTRLETAVARIRASVENLENL